MPPSEVVVAQEKRPRVSLSKALEAIATILEFAEEPGNDEETIAACLDLARDQLADSVDRRLFLVRALTGGKLSLEGATGVVGALREQIERSRRQLKMAEKTLIKIKEDTAAILEMENLNEIWGTEGKFYLQASNPSLTLSFQVQSISRSNVLPSAVQQDVPLEYMMLEHIATLNTAAVIDDLKKGKELPWAKLSQSRHLRVKHQLRL